MNIFVCFESIIESDDLVHFALGLTVFEPGHFGQGDHPPVVDGFNCLKTSDGNLLDCAISTTQIECEFGETAGIVCANAGMGKCIYCICMS